MQAHIKLIKCQACDTVFSTLRSTVTIEAGLYRFFSRDWISTEELSSN